MKLERMSPSDTTRRINCLSFPKCAVASQRFGQQEHLRFQRQGAGKFGQLLLGERQRPHGPVAKRGQFDKVQNLLDSAPEHLSMAVSLAVSLALMWRCIAHRQSCAYIDSVFLRFLDCLRFNVFVAADLIGQRKQFQYRTVIALIQLR